MVAQSRAAAAVPSFERGNSARTFARARAAAHALPVVGAGGVVRRGEKRLFAAPPAVAAVGDEEDEVAAAEEAGPPQKKKKKGKQGKRRDATADFFDDAERFAAAKAAIAGLAAKVVSNPEMNLAALAELRAMAKSRNRNVAALVIITESQLYKDIAPAYRVREISEEEAGVAVSKEVASMRNFEQGLLRAYKRFVSAAVSASRWRGGRRMRGEEWSAAERGMHKARRAACTALCEAARHLLHFNLADDVGAAVAGLTCDRDEAVRKEACAALGEVLGEAHRCAGTSLSARVVVAECLSKTVVSGRGVAQEEAVLPLLKLRFGFFSKFDRARGKKKKEEDGKFNRKKRVKMSEARAEKEAKETAERERSERMDLERDMREAHAEATPQELFAAKKRLLDATCKACFNVIKAASETALFAAGAAERARGDGVKGGVKRDDDDDAGVARTKKPPPALSAALEGVLLVASMLRIELLDAILAALSPILEGETLPIATRFRCLAAAYSILSAHAAAQTLDADAFTRDARAMDAALYKAVGQLFGPTAPLSGDETCCAEALRALAAAFAGRRMPPVRTASLARRLLIVAAAQASTHACSVGLVTAAQAMLPYHLVECLYPAAGATRAGQTDDDAGDTEAARPSALDVCFGEEAGLLQTYDMSVNDPDIANAEHSGSWELAVLQAHYHPAVRALAKLCCTGVCGERRPAGHTVSPDLIATFSSAGGGFNPAPVSTFHGPKNRAKSAARRQNSLVALVDSLDERYSTGEHAAAKDDGGFVDRDEAAAPDEETVSALFAMKG